MAPAHQSARSIRGLYATMTIADNGGNVPDEVRLHQLSIRSYWAGTEPQRDTRDPLAKETAPRTAHPDFALSPEEEEERSVLQRRRVGLAKANGSKRRQPSEASSEVHREWSLRGGLSLRTWQEESIQLWLARTDGNGTIKVVTGAGKTLVALAIVERLHDLKDEDLRIAIVVPTIVLMDQWREVLLRDENNLPEHLIGMLGGGHHDGFGDGHRVLLCVLNSASTYLPRLVDEAGIDQHLLLVVDECHRAGAAAMRQVFRTRRKWSLGLSATPEREDADDGMDDEHQDAALLSYDDSDLAHQVGPIVYNMTFADALRLGVLPQFVVEHYGLSLRGVEQRLYDDLSREIDHLREELRLQAGPRFTASPARFSQWVRRVAQQGGELAGRAQRYIGRVSARKNLLYGATARSEAAVRLVEMALQKSPDARILLFHESIEQAMLLWRKFVEAGICAVPENSQLPASIRERSLAMYRDGTANVLVSVKSLIEGFNVPETDLGIIVASSGSGRQRIQTIGRVLRKHVSDTGEEKHARICALYMANTADEAIYEKTDWDSEVGVEGNIYFRWEQLSGPPEPQPGPPISPLQHDSELDLLGVELGDEYPGRYEGIEYSADSLGNVYMEGDRTRVVDNPQGIPDLVRQTKGNYGTFRVTPKLGYVIVRIGPVPRWRTLYVTTLEEPFHLLDQPDLRLGSEAASLEPGAVYEGSHRCVDIYSVVQIRGQLRLAKRVPGGRDYARGPEAERLIAALGQAASVLGVDRLTKCCVNEQGVAFFLWQGRARFVAAVGRQELFPSSKEESA